MEVSVSSRRTLKIPPEVQVGGCFQPQALRVSCWELRGTALISTSCLGYLVIRGCAQRPSMGGEKAPKGHLASCPRPAVPGDSLRWACGRRSPPTAKDSAPVEREQVLGGRRGCPKESARPRGDSRRGEVSRQERVPQITRYPSS